MRRRLALVSGISIVVIGLLIPQAVPLYDGVGFPDEPYRYVQRPPGDVIITSPATPVSVTVPVVNGTTDGFDAASAEQGPQVSIFVPVKTLLAPADAHRITVRLDPRAADAMTGGRPWHTSSLTSRGGG